MTYTKHISGKHYIEVTGPWWAIWLYRRYGRRVGQLKVKAIYKGVK